MSTLTSMIGLKDLGSSATYFQNKEYSKGAQALSEGLLRLTATGLVGTFAFLATSAMFNQTNPETTFNLNTKCDPKPGFPYPKPELTGPSTPEVIQGLCDELFGVSSYQRSRVSRLGGNYDSDFDSVYYGRIAQEIEQSDKCFKQVFDSKFPESVFSKIITNNGKKEVFRSQPIAKMAIAFRTYCDSSRVYQNTTQVDLEKREDCIKDLLENPNETLLSKILA